MNSMVDNSCEKQAYMSYSPNQSGNFDEFLMHFVYEKNDRRQNDTGGTKCSYSKPVSNEVISPFYVDNERDNGNIYTSSIAKIWLRLSITYLGK